MSIYKENAMHTKTKEIIATIVLFIGLAMSITAMILPPLGVIDNSVLVLFGEILTFVGACWGLKEYISLQVEKIGRKREKEQEGDK